MEIKQNPFSLYDFLGYLTPGSIFLYGIMAGYAHVYSVESPYQFITTHLSFDKPEIYIPFIFAAYVLGHLLSFLSSWLIEKYSIWSNGYPSKYLLDIESGGYFDVESYRGLRIGARILVAALLLPITLFDVPVGHWAGFRKLYAKPLDKLLIAVIWKKLFALMIEHGGLKDLPEDVSAANTDFFRYAYHYAVENAPNHLPKMQNYVALYGFLRTLTLLSVFAFWAIVWHADNGNASGLNLVPWLLICALISYVFYLSFMKFYRRFSLEALMALSATYELSEKIIPVLDRIDENARKNDKLKKQLKGPGSS